MQVTIRGTIPFPPGADSAPIRQFASDLRQLAQVLQQSTNRLGQTQSFLEKVWTGAAAAAQQARGNERRQVLTQVGSAVTSVIPILEAYAGALDAAAASYTTAATAEQAARAGLPWTAAALAAAIAAESAAVLGLQAAASAAAGSAAAPIGQIAAAQFMGGGQGQGGGAAGQRQAVDQVWQQVQQTMEDGEVSEDELAAASRRLEEAFAGLNSTEPPSAVTTPVGPCAPPSWTDAGFDPTGPAVTDPVNPDTGLPIGQDYWDGVIDDILGGGAGTDAVPVPGTIEPDFTTPFGEQAYGTGSKPIDLDFAYASRDVYPESTGTLPADSHLVRATDEQLRALGIDPARLQNDATGFSAAVYFTKSGNQAVLAFAGTDQAADWNTNLNQAGSTVGGQYAQGRALAEDMKVIYGDRLALTGHSLGGGIASYAGVATNTPTVTYNSAGLSTMAQIQAGSAPWNTDQVAEAGLVRRYTVDNDVLTFYQEDNPLTDPLMADGVGTRIRLSEPSEMPAWSSIRADDRVYRHSMDVVIESMRRDQPWTSTQAAGGSADAVPVTHGASGSWSSGATGEW